LEEGREGPLGCRSIVVQARFGLVQGGRGTAESIGINSGPTLGGAPEGGENLRLSRPRGVVRFRFFLRNAEVVHRMRPMDVPLHRRAWRSLRGRPTRRAGSCSSTGQFGPSHWRAEGEGYLLRAAAQREPGASTFGVWPLSQGRGVVLSGHARNWPADRIGPQGINRIRGRGPGRRSKRQRQSLQGVGFELLHAARTEAVGPEPWPGFSHRMVLNRRHLLTPPPLSRPKEPCLSRGRARRRWSRLSRFALQPVGYAPARFSFARVSWRKVRCVSPILIGRVRHRSGCSRRPLPPLKRQHWVRVGPHSRSIRPLVGPEGPSCALIPLGGRRASRVRSGGISGEGPRRGGPAFDFLRREGRRRRPATHVPRPYRGRPRSSPGSRSGSPSVRSDEVVEGPPGVGHPLLSPVKRPVSMTTIRAMRSGFSAGEARRPYGTFPSRGPRRWTSAEVEVGEQRARLLDVAVVRVPVEVGGLVGAAKAPRSPRRDAAVPGVADRRNHLAPQVRPGGLAGGRNTTGGPSPSSRWARRSPVDLAVVRASNGKSGSPSKRSSGVREGPRSCGGRSAPGRPVGQGP